MNDHEIDLRLAEVFKRNAPSFDVPDVARLGRRSPVRSVPALHRRRILRPLAIAAAVLVVAAGVGTGVWQVARHLGGSSTVVVITDDFGTPTTNSSSLVHLSDGDWELQADRGAWLQNVRLPSDQLSEADYFSTRVERPTFTVTVSGAGAKVAVKGQGAGNQYSAEGTRSSVDELRISYDLEPAPGGRLVVWFTYEGLQAELTQYGSGRPMIFSYRGKLIHTQTEGATVTTATPITATARLYPVLVDGKWGFIDKAGTIKIEPQFAGVRRLDGAGELIGFSEGLAPVQTMKDGPWGYIDTSGRVVIEPQFDLAQGFSEGLAVVRDAGGYSFIDKSGGAMLGPFFGAINFRGGLAFVDDGGGKTGLIDKRGDWLPQVEGPNGMRLSVSSGFFEGLAAAQSPEGPEGVPASLGGYVDESGTVVIEPRFDRVTDFSEGLAAVGVGANDDVMKYGYIDKTGAWVIQPQFEQAGRFNEGLAPVGIRDAKGAFKMGYIDKSGAWAVQPQFEDAQSFSEGLALVWRTRSCGYIDKAGTLVIPIPYGTDGWDFSGGVVRVGGGFDGSPSYIDKTGKVIWQGK